MLHIHYYFGVHFAIWVLLHGFWPFLDSIYSFATTYTAQENLPVCYIILFLLACNF